MRVRYLVSNVRAPRLGQSSPAPTPAPAPAPVAEVPVGPQPRWVNEGKNDLTRTLLATATVAAIAGLSFALFK